METGQGWHVRYYEERDDEAMVALLQGAYGRWPSVDVPVAAIDHLRWKLTSRPDALRWHVVAEIDSEIVGIRPFWVRAVKARDRVLMLRQAVDGCVQPAHQRQGVAARIRAFSAEEFRRAFDLHLGGQSGHAAMRKMLQLEGQRPLGNQIEVWERKLGDGPVAREASPLRVTEARCFDERVNGFWQEASGDFDFVVARTRGYLNWRYADRRAGAFSIRIAGEGGEIAGYAVLRLLRGQGYLADLLVLPGRLDAADALIDDALRFFRDAGVERVFYWTPSRHPYKAVIAAQGFAFRRPRKRILTYMPLGSTWEELAFLQDPSARVHFTIGDLDVV
jgi:hypothetical protein